MLEIGQGLCLNPYVTQMEKLSKSLKYLSGAFKLKQGDSTIISEGNLKQIEHVLRNEVCESCNQNQKCGIVKEQRLLEMTRTLWEEIDEYGMELSVRKKRELERECHQFLRVKEQVEKEFTKLKNEHLWESRMHQNQDASLIAMQVFASAMQEVTSEIDASLFQDERLERRITTGLRKLGVRPLKIVLFMSEYGRYEVHITAKIKNAQTKIGGCITTKQIADMISYSIGSTMVPEKKERMVLSEEYDTMVFVERARYQILSGMAKQTKEGSCLSGDNFLILNTSNGKTSVLLSDGMGSGQAAYLESNRVLELAEVLLESGISPQLAMKMINVAFIEEGKEVAFATLDVCRIDTYSGEIEMLKAGATTSYYISNKKCKQFSAASLPMGVVPEIQINHYKFYGDKNGYIVMLTDGVLDSLCKDAQKEFIQTTIKQTKTKNPNEIAARILEEAIGIQGGEVRDDMMVLVIGVWELHF
ncbi:MAG: SpoIIE family protein phosphatase [Eubacteriales bacterium]